MQRHLVLLGFTAATAAIVACQDATAPKVRDGTQGVTDAQGRWKQSLASSIHGIVQSFASGRDSSGGHDSSSTPVRFASVTIYRLGPVVDSVPPDSVPRDTVPRDTVPRDTIPRDTIPRDTIPRDTIPRDTIPRDTIPRDTIPRDTMPRDTTHNDTLYLKGSPVRPAHVSAMRIARSAQQTPTDSGSLGAFICGQHVSPLQVVTADASGAYAFTRLAAGAYGLRVAAPGYVTVTACSPLLLQGQSLQVNLYLTKLH